MVIEQSLLACFMQELYLWKSVAAAGRTALGLRYALLSYISTAFRKSSKSGLPVAQPLWFAFPEDEETHGIDQQWLLGSDILISPVLYEVTEKADVTTTNVAIPVLQGEEGAAA